VHTQGLLVAACAARHGHRPASATALAWPGPYVTVNIDGSADFTGFQAAVDAVPAANTSTVRMKSGVYKGQVVIPSTKPYLVLRGQGGDHRRPGQRHPKPDNTLGHLRQRLGYHRRP
jgi:pectinesterase